MKKLKAIIKSALSSSWMNKDIERYVKKAHLKYEMDILKDIKLPYYNFKESNSLFITEVIKEINNVLNLKNEKEIESYTRRFEEEFADFCECKYGIGLSSGTTSLAYSLLAAGIKPGEEVIIPPNTYIATAMAVQDIGAVPVFADIDIETYNIDAEKVTDKITDKTRAVIPIHLYGHMADMDKLKKITKQFNLILIEDASQAHGGEYKGKKAGSYGMTGCFSLHWSKIIGCWGEGGIVVTDSSSLYNQIMNMIEPYYGRESLKGKRTPARLSAVHCAVCRAKLRKINELIEEKIGLAQAYFGNLSGVEEIKLPPRDENYKDVFRNFTITAKNRDELSRYLLKKGVETRIFYKMPLHLREEFKHLGYKAGSYPVSEGFVQNTLSLPIGIHLSKKDIEYISSQIVSFYRR